MPIFQALTPRRYGRIAAVCVATTLAFTPVPSRSQTANAQNETATIVLVPGAWADASRFAAVVVRLRQAGYAVSAPPNERRGLRADAHEISTLFETVAGPVNPSALQRKTAERANAHVSHTNGSHPSMIEHPEATVAAIMAAMTATHTR